MQNRRTHYFPANDCTVITGLLPTGQFVAFRMDQERPRGYGHSILSAIADLNEAIAVEGSIYERDDDNLIQAAE